LLRALYSDSNAPFRLYLAFQWKDFPDNSSPTITARALETMQVWLRYVSSTLLEVHATAQLVEALRYM
jgi:hypothetical protein